MTQLVHCVTYIGASFVLPWMAIHTHRADYGNVLLIIDITSHDANKILQFIVYITDIKVS
jgi:hypothetical protein